MFREDKNVSRIRDELMGLSHFLGTESYQLAILGERNSSAKILDGKDKNRLRRIQENGAISYRC